MSSDSERLASRMNRRGVTPLVTLVNLSGHSALKSGSTLSRSNWLCSSATPFTLRPATEARWAIRMARTGNSATIDMRRMRISSPGELVDDLLEELLVDPVDDLQVPRQEASEQVDRPDLQSLGQQGVAGVGEALLGDGPRLVPLEPLEVDEDPHQFRHRDDRMGVVELEDDPLVKAMQVEARLQHVLDVVVQGARHEEVLLLQAELLTLRRGVLGVEHLGDVLGERLGAHGLRVVAAVEDL